MDTYVNGLLFGLLLAVMIGPVFFALIQTSIERGFSSGFFMAIGISLSDSLYFLISWLGISQFSQSTGFQSSMGLVGGIIMLAFAIFMFFKPVPKKGLRNDAGQSVSPITQVVKGFLLNGINPSVLLYWVGIIGVAKVTHGYQGGQVVTFFAGIITMVFITDVLKAYLSQKLRNLVTPRFMMIMNRTVGTALAVFSITLFYRAIDLIWHL